MSNEYSYTQRSLLAAVYRFVIMASLNTGMLLCYMLCNSCMYSFNLYHPANFTLRGICNALATVKYKWFSIGIQLGVPYHKLKEFEKEDNSLAATIDFFLKGNVEGVSLSWDSIVTALKSSSVLEPALARRIQREYSEKERKSDKSAAKGTILHVYTFSYNTYTGYFFY